MTESLDALQKAVERDLGTFGEGARPLFDNVRRLVAALEPGPDGEQLSPKQRAGCVAGLASALDALEDLLEALQVAAHDGSKDGRGPGELR